MKKLSLIGFGLACIVMLCSSCQGDTAAGDPGTTPLPKSDKQLTKGGKVGGGIAEGGPEPAPKGIKTGPPPTGG